MNYYELLGVTPYVTEQQLKKAYKLAVRKYHPDITHSKKTEEMFKKILEAYGVLRDPVCRMKYDREMKERVAQLHEKESQKPVDFLKEMAYRVKYNFAKFNHNPQTLKEKVDRVLLKMDDGELKEKMLLSNNLYVQLNAAKALRLKNKQHSVNALLSGLFSGNEELMIHILALISGLKLKQCLICLLRCFPYASNQTRKEMIAIFKKFDNEFINYLLSIHVPKEEPSCKSIAFEVGCWL